MLRFMPAMGVRALIVAVIVACTVALGRDSAGRRAPPTAVVVVAADGASFDGLPHELASRGYDVTDVLADIHGVRINVRGDAAPAVADLQQIAGVRYAEAVVHMQVTDSPSDPLFSRESAYLNAVNAPAAWDIEKGSPDIVVAVVDTGVDINHPDLRANIWTNPREIPNNGADDDGDGCVDDVNGCAFVSDSSPGCSNVTNGFINDDIGHGTFVSGVIAAAANGAGMVGVARNVRIMPVKVLDCYGAGDSVATARGIEYAVRNGARVINLSLGGLNEAQVVVDAVAEATSAGVIVVAASGNGGGPGIAFPARIPQVLAVGAAASSNPDRRAAFSSWGPEVDVVAVGEGVVGTLPQSRCFVLLPCLPDGPYAVGNGTSFSTPQVSGLAALMLSAKRDLTPGQISDIIKSTATALPPADAPGWAGSGRVNMVAALRAVKSNQPVGDPCTVQSVTDGESFTCTTGRQVRMLQMDAPLPGECGGDWAKAALQYIFLTPGRTVYLRYDGTRLDAQGRTLAAPIWRGSDGADYNLSIVVLYVGLARAADVGAGNVAYHDWAFASEHWAAIAQWNMWAPAKPFTGGC